MRSTLLKINYNIFFLFTVSDIGESLLLIGFAWVATTLATCTNQNLLLTLSNIRHVVWWTDHNTNLKIMAWDIEWGLGYAGSHSIHWHTVSHHNIIASGYNLTDVIRSAQRKCKSVGTDILFHGMRLVIIISEATGPGSIGTHEILLMMFNLPSTELNWNYFVFTYIHTCTQWRSGLHKRWRTYTSGPLHRTQQENASGINK